MRKIVYVVVFICNILAVNTSIGQTKRYVKTVATGLGNGSSWANASSSLQAMLNASASNDEVWVAKGTYKPTMHVGYNASHVAYTDDRHKAFLLKTGVKLYGGFAGTESTIGQRQMGTNKTILSGDLLGNDVGITNNGENAYHVLVAIGAHGARIDGFTITGGNTTGKPATFIDNGAGFPEVPADGAGVYAYDCDYYLTVSIFSNNFSSRNGGAIANYGFNQNGFTGRSDITGCLFVNNRAQQGSVLYAAGSDNSFCYVTNATASNNISAGATVVSGGNKVTVTNTILWGNTFVGTQVGTTDVAITKSLVQTGSVVNTSSLLAAPPDPGPDPLDPSFIRRTDPDGTDEILGTADDGLVPLCGPAIGAGTNDVVLPSKDINGNNRIQNGTIDIGAYETSLIQQVTAVPIGVTYSGAADPVDGITENDLPASGACEGSSVTFSTTATGNGGIYQWKRNGINVGTNSPSYQAADFHANDQVVLVYNGIAGCAIATVVTSNTITLNNVSTAKPVIPSAIQGAVNACPNINSGTVAYKINKAPGAVIYYWQLNVPGATIVSHPNGPGVNDTIVLVSFNSDFVTGKITVSARNWCGWSSQKYMTISRKTLSAPGTITGPVDLCPYMPSAENPAGATVRYAVNKVVDATSYLWTIPSGATIDSHSGTGINDTAIFVKFNNSFVSGVITVQASNFCESKSRTLSISRKVAGTPGSITGPTSVCAYKQSASNPLGTPVDYVIKKVPYATSYTWTLPAGASATHPGGTGINDTIARVTFASGFAGGAITVKSNTNCNTSAARSLSILYKIPSTPGVITAGTSTACPQRRITYSINSLPSYATSVQWIVPASGTIISGQGSTSIVVEFSGATTTADSVKAMGINDCGASNQRKMKVGVLPSCREAGNNSYVELSSRNTLHTNSNESFEVAVMPNPSHQDFKLRINSSDIKSPVTIRITDYNGRVVELKNGARANQLFSMGEMYNPGVYIAEIIQGAQRKTVRLVKL